MSRKVETKRGTVAWQSWSCEVHKNHHRSVSFTVHIAVTHPHWRWWTLPPRLCGRPLCRTFGSCWWPALSLMDKIAWSCWPPGAVCRSTPSVRSVGRWPGVWPTESPRPMRFLSYRTQIWTEREGEGWLLFLFILARAITHTHTHTHTHACTHALTHTQIHTQTQIYAHLQRYNPCLSIYIIWC